MHDIPSAVDAAIESLRTGGFAMLVDEPDRKDEGDLVLAVERVDALGIRMMVNHNTARYETPFTVSLDLKDGTTSGSSAIDRAATVQVLLDPAAKLADFLMPGHVFPL